ncbi:glycerol-3-phosphate ABC transporter substrate-binding protein [Neisseria perflava]|nr:glycerol-3-phosphate ABC transporter substrate-binding protein [Neisseria perflava]
MRISDKGRLNINSPFLSDTWKTFWLTYYKKSASLTKPARISHERQAFEVSRFRFGRFA